MSLSRSRFGFVAGVLCPLLVDLSAFGQLNTETPAPQSAPANSAPPQPDAVEAPEPLRPAIVAPDLAQGALAPAPTPSRRTATRAQSLPPPEPETQWYGWQTLTVDALSIAAVAGGIALENAYIGIPGVGVYLFGAPAVHWYRGEVGRGFISFGMRFTASALVVIGGAVCVASSLTGTDGVACAAPLVGLLLVPVSIAVDAVLAWEETPVEIGGTRQISPWFSAERRAFGVNWQGTF